jgi:hypothetical protein
VGRQGEAPLARDRGVPLGEALLLLCLFFGQLCVNFSPL